MSVCPACGNVLKEPLPQCCPVCQLEGLNRIFLTREEYENWKKTVLDEHMKKLHNPKVSVGHDGALVLLDDGQLFGFGNNTQGQYSSNHIGEEIKMPEKIADNVISAAAGYNYSLYVDSSGKIHFLGKSGVAFKERFEQPTKAKKVFADPKRDVFWMTDNNDNLYIWGDNHEQYIENFRENLLCQMSDIECSRIVKYYWFAENRWGHFTCGKPPTRFIDLPSLSNLEVSIKSEMAYRDMKDKYGDNLRMEFFISEEKMIENSYDRAEKADDKIHRVLREEFKNDCKKFKTCDVYDGISGSGAVYGTLWRNVTTPKEPNFWGEVTSCKREKYCKVITPKIYVSNKYIYTPQKTSWDNWKLNIDVEKTSIEDKVNCSEITEIVDYVITKDSLYILDISRKLWKGKLDYSAEKVPLIEKVKLTPIFNFDDHF